MNFTQWEDFKGNSWKNAVNVRRFIQSNYTPYKEDSSFLCGPTERTKKLMDKLNVLLAKEREKNGVLDIDVDNVSRLSRQG